jgi:ABC-2 type transport system ATP-binding protein
VRGKTVCLTTHLMEEAEKLCDRVAIIDHGRIVDIGSPAALVGRHCPERTVVLACDEARADAALAAVPNVSSVSREGSDIVVHGTGDEMMTNVIQCLAEHRIRITDFRTVMPTLEDVFLKLTGHSIRA